MNNAVDWLSACFKNTCNAPYKLFRDVGTDIFKSTIGAIGTPLDCVSLGLTRDTNDVDLGKLAFPSIYAAKILPHLAQHLIPCINPTFTHSEKTFRLPGIIYRYTAKILADYYDRNNTQSNLQPLASRVVALIFIPTAVIARVADLALGIIPLAIMPFLLGPGQNNLWIELRVNILAQTNILAVANDLSLGIRAVINPWRVKLGWTEIPFPTRLI